MEQQEGNYSFFVLLRLLIFWRIFAKFSAYSTDCPRSLVQYNYVTTSWTYGSGYWLIIVFFINRNKFKNICYVIYQYEILLLDDTVSQEVLTIL